MVNSSAMVTGQSPEADAGEALSYSFSEILESSPPPSSKKQHFTKDVHNPKAAHPPGLRRQSSKAGLFDRLTNGKIRNSVLRKDLGSDRGRSTRASFLADGSSRQNSAPANRELKGTTDTPRNRSYGAGVDVSTASASFNRAPATKERVTRMASDPPPLGSAYSQAVKYGPIMAPTGSVDMMLRTYKSHDHLKKAELEIAAANKRPLTPNGTEPYSTKVFVLTTTGYLLQYAGEGNHDRMPERMMKLTPNSAAMASDAIPGKHWVLHISATFENEAAHHRSRFALSKLGLGGGLKPATRNFLLIMDSADELDGWLVALRREIQSLGGADCKPDTTNQKTLEDHIEDSMKRDDANTDIVSDEPTAPAKRPGLARATTAPEGVVAHRITSSMAKRGLLLRMDESDTDEEPDASVSISNTQVLPPSTPDATSPAASLSITDSASHRSRPSTDTSSSPRHARAGRGTSESTQSGPVFFHINDLDSVIQGTIPRHSIQPAPNGLTRKPTGLRKKTIVVNAQSMSPVLDQPFSATTQSTRSTLQPLSAGFKRLSPLPDIGPIVLTPPDSPELSINLRPRSMSMLENAAPSLSPRPTSLHSPISDPGLLSPNRVTTDHDSHSAVRSSKLEESPSSKSPPIHIPVAGDERKDSTSSVGSDHIVAQTVSWIPPRHSSLMYQHGVIPGSGGSSGKSTPSSARKESITAAKTEKLKMRLAALDAVNLPHANALLLAPSPHPPPTGALPELPKNRSPAGSRSSSRADQVRKASIVSASSQRSSSVASIRKLSDAERSITPDSTTKQDETLVVQVTPRKARVEKVILPSMADVPATRPNAHQHPAAVSGPSLTVAERRRRRSPSPVHSRARSNSTAEKVLSAISEMTETSEAPRGLDEMIVIGFAEPVEEEPVPAQKKGSSSNKNLLPNGMPNPLAGNPIGTPDMRMIPRPPSRDAPAVPSIPAVHAEDRKDKGKQKDTHKGEVPAVQPLARRPSILERAVAALEAAKEGKAQSSRSHNHPAESESQSESPSDPLAAVAPHFQEVLRPIPPRQASLKPVNAIPAPESTAQVTAAAPPSVTASAELANQSSFAAQSAPGPQPQIPPENSDYQEPSESPLPPPPPPPSTKPPPKHIAQLLAIAELPAEPMTPGIPEMKASITGFSEDEFDMWAWPVGAGSEPGERFAPLRLDLSGEEKTESDESREASGEQDRPRGRWSLFKAIEGIE